MGVNIGLLGNRRQTRYFFRIGLYPSAINRARIVSASLMSENGPTCTRNSLSVGTGDATNAGYCFFLSASTNESASSCLLTAAPCTKYPAVGSVVVGSGVPAGGVCAGVALAGAVSVFALVAGVNSGLASFCSTDL